MCHGGGVKEQHQQFSHTYILHQELIAKIEAVKAYSFVGWDLPTSPY